MKKSMLGCSLVLALLFSSITGLLLVNLATANSMPEFGPPILSPIIINSDGSIEPATAPIQRNGETFTLSNSIENYTLLVLRDNITLDGRGFALIGNRSNGIRASGIYLSQINHVTIKNFKISLFEYGIMNNDCTNNSIIGNEIHDCHDGIIVMTSSGIYVSGNIISRNHCGIYNWCISRHSA